jgi:hypothetical protein
LPIFGPHRHWKLKNPACMLLNAKSCEPSNWRVNLAKLQGLSCTSACAGSFQEYCSAADKLLIRTVIRMQEHLFLSPAELSFDCDINEFGSCNSRIDPGLLTTNPKPLTLCPQ